jgi:hypothetical protein
MKRKPCVCKLYLLSPTDSLLDLSMLQAATYNFAENQ